MNRIIKYEIQRLIFSKSYIGLFAVNILFAVIILNTETILGTGYTSPFSGWSLGSYWAMTLPITMAAVLFMLKNYYFNSAAVSADTLVTSAPFKPFHYAIARVTAVTFCFALIIFILFITVFLFIHFIFNEKPLYEITVTLLLTVLPCYSAVLGFGWFLARIRPFFLYALIIIVLVAGFFPVNNVFDFFAGGYFNNEPLNLPAGADGEPPFTLSLNFIYIRIIYFITGAAVLFLSVIRRPY